VLAPTPVLQPSPIDIGGLFSGSIEALKRRFGLLVLISLMPALAVLAVMALATMLMVPSIVALANGDRTAAPTGLIAGVALFVFGMLVAVLLQVKAYGMLSQAAYEIAQGQFPDFRGVLARTRGFLPRMASVIAIGVLAVVAIYGLFAILVFGAIGSVASSGQESASGALAVVGLIMLLSLAAVPLGLFLGTKLLYTVPAVAIEGLGGIEGMKRSWNLTRGAFWRTLGYYLLAAFAVAMVSSTVSMIGQVALLPLGMNMSSLPDNPDPAQALAVVGAMIPAMLVIYALQVIVQMVAYPFLQSYLTYMFIDQVRRSEMPAPPAYGYPGGPGYYAPPGQYYAQPQQGYPAQWQPDPGRSWQPPGWTPPGQAQPPQQPGSQQTPPPQGWSGWQQGGQQPPSGQGRAQG